MKKQTAVGFEISLSGRDDGTLEAVYICLLPGKAARTQEIIEDMLLADYDEAGELIGLELLAPVRLRDLTDIVDETRRESFTRFVQTYGPAEFLKAA